MFISVLDEVNVPVKDEAADELVRFEVASADSRMDDKMLEDSSELGPVAFWITIPLCVAEITSNVDVGRFD